jgi:hypothetical protein
MFGLFKTTPINFTNLNEDYKNLHFTVESLQDRTIFDIKTQYLGVNDGDFEIFVIRGNTFDHGYLSQDKDGKYYILVQNKYKELQPTDIIYLSKVGDNYLVLLDKLEILKKLKMGIKGKEVININKMKNSPNYSQMESVEKDPVGQAMKVIADAKINPKTSNPNGVRLAEKYLTALRTRTTSEIKLGQRSKYNTNLITQKNIENSALKNFQHYLSSKTPVDPLAHSQESVDPVNQYGNSHA